MPEPDGPRTALAPVGIASESPRSTGSPPREAHTPSSSNRAPTMPSRYRRGRAAVLVRLWTQSLPFGGMPVLDIEQALLLLELDPPFDQRAVQLARRRLAKRWHPDLAPAGQAGRARAPPQGHQPRRRPARAPGRGLARRAACRRNAVKVSAAAAREAREEEGRRAYEAEQRARARGRRPQAQTTRSATACPTTRSCTATRAACPIPSGAWAASPASTSPATATTSQQWARVKFQVGVRTVPGRLAPVRRLLHARRRAPTACSAS